jgi:hypothetical protein
MRVLKPRLWGYATLAGLAVLLLLLALARQGAREGLRFRNVQELKVWAEGHGLYCRSDWEDGRVTDGVAIATHPLTWEQVGRLCRSMPGAGDEWDGVLWAMTLPGNRDVEPILPWGGDCRRWGEILVAGDPALLDRLEGKTK